MCTKHLKGKVFAFLYTYYTKHRGFTAVFLSVLSLAFPSSFCYTIICVRYGALTTHKEAIDYDYRFRFRY